MSGFITLNFVIVTRFGTYSRLIWFRFSTYVYTIDFDFDDAKVKLYDRKQLLCAVNYSLSIWVGT